MISNKCFKQKKLFLLDMDGTIYLDNILFDKSLEFLQYIKSIGGKYVFLTNNSSRSVKDYIRKLNKLSINVDETNFMTSSQITAIYLKENFNKKKIYVVGTESLKQELLMKKVIVVDKLCDDIDCLLVGFDTELNYGKLHDACFLLRKNIPYIATNLDLVCPTSFGFTPDCGSICKMLEIATNKTPKFLGKPNPMIIEYAIRQNGYSIDETIVIGDRLYTDIACGINAGVCTGVVLTGETKLIDLDRAKYKPNYVFENISELYFQLTK